MSNNPPATTEWNVTRLETFPGDAKGISLNQHELPPDHQLSPPQQQLLRRVAKQRARIAVKTGPSFQFRFPAEGIPVSLKQLPQSEWWGLRLRHFSRVFRIRQNHPKFKALQEAVQARRAVSVITHPDSAEIDDCPFPGEEPTCYGTGLQALVPVNSAPTTWDEANKMFDKLNSISNRDGIPFDDPNYIPFAYPDDGCYFRAHKACRVLMENQNWNMVFKMWIQVPSGNVPTANCPDCSVGWQIHIAPAVNVNGSDAIRTVILDPSLFSKAVTFEDWSRRINGDAAAQSGSVPYWAVEDADDQNWYTDAQLQCTEQQLQYYRNVLHERVCRKGWPPYPCSIPGNS